MADIFEIRGMRGPGIPNEEQDSESPHEVTIEGIQKRDQVIKIAGDETAPDDTEKIRAGASAGIGTTIPVGSLARSEKPIMFDKLLDDAERLKRIIEEFIKIGNPPEIPDIIRDVANQIGDGRLSPTPEMLAFMQQNPQLLKQPTPRSMMLQSAVTAIMAGLAGAGQAASSRGLPRTEASAEVMKTGAAYIEESLMQDRALAFEVAKKNADIISKNRENVLKLWEEIDKNNREVEKARLSLFSKAIDGAKDLYRTQETAKTERVKTFEQSRREMMKEAADVETKYLDRRSRENISEFEARSRAAIEQAKLRLDSLKLLLDVTKLRNDDLVNMSEKRSAEVAALSEILAENGADPTLFSFDDKVPRAVWLNNVAKASDIGSAWAEALIAYSDDMESGVKGSQKVAKMVNELGKLANVGVIVNPRLVTRLSRNDMRIAYDAAENLYALGVFTKKEIEGMQKDSDILLNFTTMYRNYLVAEKKAAATEDPIKKALIEQKLKQMRDVLERNAQRGSPGEMRILSKQSFLVMLEKLSRDKRMIAEKRWYWADIPMSEAIQERLETETNEEKKKK